MDLYIVVSQTGTYFSRLLRAVNREPYNHVSIGLEPELTRLYSFGRQCLFFPLAAGFVREEPGHGVYCQYSDTRCVVYRLSVKRRAYEQAQRLIRQFEQNEWRYRYNFAGLLAMLVNIPIERDRHFVCSQFVAYVLEQSGAYSFDRDFSLVRPRDFMRLKGARLIYEGRLNDYAYPVQARLLPYAL